MALRIRLLGGFEVLRLPGSTVHIPARKAQALLALLARCPGKPNARAALAALLWPDAGPAQARASLRQALKQVRRALGGDAGVLRSEEGSLVLDAGVETDVATLERCRNDGAAEMRAVDLYLGDFLDGFAAPTDALEEWIGFERATLRETALSVLARLAETAAEDANAREAAVRGAIRLLSLDPLQEPLHRMLMQLYLSDGRRGDAVAQYRLCRDVLARELDVLPAVETEALFRSIHQVPSPPERDAERPALAVLPLRALSSDEGQDYLSEGLTEDIIAALTRWRSFPVIRGAAPHARYRLEGTVRRQNRRVRIGVWLSDSESGTQLWAERYDREFEDIFALQDEITLRIAATIAPQLTRAELKRGRAKQPEDLGAWDCLVRGMAKLRERTPESNLEARRLFKQALAARADYSEAHAGVAMSYNYNILADGERDRRAAARKALEAARKSAALEPASAVAHQEISTALQLLDRPDEALAEIRIAVELNPYDAVGMHQLGNKSDLAGDPRGIGYMEQAHRLNPLEMRVHFRLAFLARAYLNAADFAKAEQAARNAIQLRPDHAQAHYLLALALGGMDKMPKARFSLARSEELEPGILAARRNWAPYRDPASNAGLRALRARFEKD